MLRVGHVGAGKGESFNPGRGGAWIDTSRQYQLYDPLTRVNPDLTQAPGLALEWNGNDDHTVYEVKLRPDVVFHDGKSFGADDVIYTLQQMGDPKHLGHFAVANINLAELKKINDLTVQIPLKNPNVDLAGSFVNGNTVMVQDGETDFTHPIGTGPFKFGTFTPGERSHSPANENYWEEGKPYVDAWEDISIDDPDARLNALMSGELDAMSQLGVPAGEGAPRLRRHQRRERAEPVDALLLHGGRHRSLRQPQGPRGVPLHPRPAGADRRRDLRLRHARQRPLRQGLQVLRRRHAGARGRPREGEVAAQGGRAREPRR